MISGHREDRVPRAVLIVEDEPELASLLRDVLRDAGYQVILSAPRAAVERAAELQPNVVIVDYGMPGMTGGEVVAAMRKSAGDSMPPIILVTGRAEAPALAAGLGAAAYLRKPFDMEDLVALVDRFSTES